MIPSFLCRMVESDEKLKDFRWQGYAFPPQAKGSEMPGEWPPEIH